MMKVIMIMMMMIMMMSCSLFFWYGCLTKGVKPYFQKAPLSEILIVTDILLAANKI